MTIFRPIPRRRFLLLAAATGLALAPGAAALAAGRVLLRVEGPAGRRTFSEADFADLPPAALTTHTVWTEGPRHFEGVALQDLLAAAGYDAAALAGRSLRLRALNDYEVTIPADDAALYNPLLARLMDGEPMPRSGKGPLWLVYPRDDFEELHDQRFDHRWAWQLAVITVD